MKRLIIGMSGRHEIIRTKVLSILFTFAVDMEDIGNGLNILNMGAIGNKGMRRMHMILFGKPDLQ